MKIVIMGATGTAGRATTHAAQRAGHEVVALSRATGVDLHTGAGLIDGIRGADVLIDTANPFPNSPYSDLVETFADATGRLVAACGQAGVQRLVHLSICNIDDEAFGQFDYYVAKRAQEEVLAESSLPHTIIRSTQWMEFALNPGAVTQDEAAVWVEDWLIQPVAVTSVAQVLVEAASTEPRDRQVAGPEQIRLPNLTRALLDATGDARPVTATAPSMPVLREGLLLAPAGAELLGPTPAEWVGSHHTQA